MTEYYKGYTIECRPGYTGTVNAAIKGDWRIGHVVGSDREDAIKRAKNVIDRWQEKEK